MDTGRKAPPAKGRGPFETTFADGWIDGLRLKARDLAAGAGEAQNRRDRTELPGFARLIACGASKKGVTN